MYGPLGAGKKTRLNCLLKGLFGPVAEKLRLETLTFQVPSGKKVDINLVCSSYHIELNPSDVGVYDRHIIQDVIKQSASTVQLDPNLHKKFKGILVIHSVIVIMEADRLTKDAQQALRRTMEKYSESCRIILLSESLSPIIDPIQSRCLCVDNPCAKSGVISQMWSKMSKPRNPVL
ncbi:Replication factor C subunit 5 [Thelohanellus kitauei]|uniref:Replication factor C subunit 5 n=1 Tax=Thelohanellus kitauei TaxID=669202 RepID=A0A0C2IYH8_THEKT|nr:Replication factor C subunit 5 [Thelohanellus kitauei]